MAGNTMAQRLTGNRLTGDGRRAAGKSNPYLSRKIYFFCCRRLVFYQLISVPQTGADILS